MKRTFLVEISFRLMGNLKKTFLDQGIHLERCLTGKICTQEILIAAFLSIYVAINEKLF